MTAPLLNIPPAKAYNTAMATKMQNTLEVKGKFEAT